MFSKQAAIDLIDAIVAQIEKGEIDISAVRLETGKLIVEWSAKEAEESIPSRPGCPNCDSTMTMIQTSTCLTCPDCLTDFPLTDRT